MSSNLTLVDLRIGKFCTLHPKEAWECFLFNPTNIKSDLTPRTDQGAYEMLSSNSKKRVD